MVSRGQKDPSAGNMSVCEEVIYLEMGMNLESACWQGGWREMENQERRGCTGVCRWCLRHWEVSAVPLSFLSWRTR